MMMQPDRYTGDAPHWLVDLLVTPPLWVLVGLVLTAGVCLVVAARKLAKSDWHITPTEQRQMLLIIGTAEGVGIGVMVAMDALPLGYFAAVGVGLVGGFAAVEVLRRCEPLITALTPDENAVFVAGWVLVGGTAFVAPGVVKSGVAGRGLLMGVGGLAAGMVLWVAYQAQEDNSAVEAGASG